MDYELGRFTTIDLVAEPVEVWEKYYAWSPYQYSMNNPISLLDENGKFVKMVFNKSARQLYVLDLDNFQAGLPNRNVTAADYQLGGIRNSKGELIANQTLVIDNVFTGGVADGDGNVVRDPDRVQQKPLDNGTYDVVDNYADTKHSGWFRLDKQDASSFNDKDDATNRNGFRLHIGVESWGCVTVNAYQDNIQNIWNVLSTIMNSTSTTTVKENRGKQWLLPWSTLTKYGTIEVKGTDNIPVKEKDGDD